MHGRNSLAPYSALSRTRPHYGPFVAHRRRYASLPKDLDAEDVTLDAAAALLERQDAPGG